MVKVKKIFMTTTEAAKVMGVTPATVRNWIIKGYLRAFRPPSALNKVKGSKRGAEGYQYRIKVSDCDNFVARGQTVKTKSRA